MMSLPGLTPAEKKEYRLLYKHPYQLSREAYKRFQELKDKNVAYLKAEGTTGLQRASKPMRKTKLKQVSKKQAKVNAQYTKLRREFLLEHPICEFPGCGAEATDVHHRSRRGINTLNVGSWVQLCRQHHTFVEENPKWSREHGFIIS